MWGGHGGLGPRHLSRGRHWLQEQRGGWPLRVRRGEGVCTVLVLGDSLADSASHQSLLTYTPRLPYSPAFCMSTLFRFSHFCPPISRVFSGDGSDENSDPIGVQQLPPSSSQRANPPTAGKRKRTAGGSKAAAAAAAMALPYYPGGHLQDGLLPPLTDDAALLDFGALLEACQQHQGFDVSALLAVWQQGQRMQAQTQDLQQQQVQGPQQGFDVSTLLAAWQQAQGQQLQQRQVQEQPAGDSEGGGGKRTQLGRGGGGGRGRRGRQPPAPSGQLPALSGQLPAVWGGQEDGAAGSGEGPLTLPPWLSAAMAQVEGVPFQQADNVLQQQGQQQQAVAPPFTQAALQQQEGGHFVEERLPPESDDGDDSAGEKRTAAAEAPPPLREGKWRRGRGREATQLRPLGKDGRPARLGAAGNTGTTGSTGQQQQGLPQGRLAGGSSGSWTEADDRVVLKTLLQMVGGSIDLRGGRRRGMQIPTVSVPSQLPDASLTPPPSSPIPPAAGLTGSGYGSRSVSP